MMPTELRLKTRVLPGGRLEVIAPELPENADVELIVALPAGVAPPRPFRDVIEFLDSLTPVPRSLEEWDQVERELREERDAWDS